jgi:hypothetical protein
MRSPSVSSVSITEIKKLAKDIKKQTGAKHHEALARASALFGFANFHIATKRLGEDSTPGFDTKIVLPWNYHEERTKGKASRTIQLQKPLSEIVKPHHMCGRLGGFRLSEGCLVSEERWASQDVADWYVLKTARVLQFMDITGFKPCRKSNLWPNLDWNSKIPGSDHYEVWYDPIRKKYIMTDEPYRPAYRQVAQERQDWCDQHGYQAVQTRWPGMHNPDEKTGTTLFLIARNYDAVPLRSIEKKLADAVFPN